MQISRNDDEQSAHLKTSFEAFKKKVNQQAEHFNSSNRVHLRSEHRRSSSHLSDHRTVSIHIMCFDLIRFQRRTWLQAKKECDINLHKRHSNSNDSDHFRRFQKHRRSDSERWILSVFNTSTAEHDHLRRAVAFDHQSRVFLHQESQSATQSISCLRINAASAHALRSAKLSTETENQIRCSLQQRSE